jgi:autotransporter-associated beta strand protein
MTRQIPRSLAQDGHSRSLVCCIVGRRRSWLRAALLASVALATAAHAQDAIWRPDPPTSDFNTATNWVNSVLPGVLGTATFNASNQTQISFSQTTTLGGISVTTGSASEPDLHAYIFQTNGNSVTFNGAGLNAANGASITFNNTGATLTFAAGSTAGNSMLTNGTGGQLFFFDKSSAGSARIVNNGTLQFSDLSSAADATIQNNGGDLQFFGFSSAGRATIISDGGNAITLRDSANLGTARLNLINGSLDLSGLVLGGASVGSIQGGGTVFLAGKSLAIGGNNLSTTFAGVIADSTPSGAIPGHGVVTKEGTGTLTLTGKSTFTAEAEVVGGALVVDGSLASAVAVHAGATLAGTGTVGSTTILDGGTLVAGHNTAPFGALTVKGDLVFTAAATYMVQFSPSDAGKTNVTGLARLGGATVQAVFVPGTYVTRQSTILHADAGLDNQSGTDRFGKLVTNLSPFFAASLSYDASNVFLDLRALSPQLTPGNVNQRNVAGAIINSFNTVGGLPGVFMTLTPAALTQVSGETAVGSQQATFDAMHQFMGVMLDPTIGGRGGPVTGSGYAPMPRKALVVDPFGARWNIWAAGFGGTQTISGDAVLGSNKTTSNVFGGAVGADYHVSPNTVAGVALAGGGTNFRVANGGSGESDLFQAGAHLRHTQGAAFIAAALAYGWQDVTTKRTVTVDGIDSLRGHFHANAFSGRLESGFRIATQSIDLTPYAAGQFISYRLPSYAEQAASGSGPFALSYDGKTATAARTELGVKTEKAVALSDSILLLRSRLAWAHEFDRDRSVTAEFQALPASAFVVNGARPAADSALTTLSAELVWRNGWSAGATFDSQLSDTTRSYAGKGTVRYAW